MGEHLKGVDTGVGATGEGEGNGLTQNSGEGLFEGLLHRDAIRLRLRAMESGSVICEADEVAHLTLAIIRTYTPHNLLPAG